MLIETILVQLWKALKCIVVTVLGIVIGVRLMQPLKVRVPMMVKFVLLGSITDDRLGQLSKALLPMLSTELGMVIEPRLVQL